MHRPSSLTVLTLLALGALVACGEELSEPAPAAVQPPLARLLLPRFGDPAVELGFDAGASQSPGGSLTRYRFTFGDGSPLVEAGTPRVRHTYGAEGVYAVLLEVVDLQGRAARASGQVTVRVGAPVCTKDEDCATPDVCREARCSTTVAGARTHAAGLENERP